MNGAKFKLGQTVYSKIYREADKGIVTAIVRRESIYGASYIYYEVMYEDGQMRDEAEEMLSDYKMNF